MSKILFIGDPHIKISKFSLGKDLLYWIDEVIEKYKPDIVINLGDSFDGHAILRSEILSEFKEHIIRVTSKVDKYLYILGNHDMFKPNDSTYHALQVFKDLDKFIVIDKVTDIDELTLVPYQANLSNFPKQTKEICVAHNTFIGADYGFMRPDVGVNADEVSANVIISGHIHLKQEFGKVIYPGTPYCENANDVDQIKGLLLFDSSTYQRTFIPSPFPTWISIDIELNNNIEEVYELIATGISRLKNDGKYQDTLIINIVGNKAEITSLFNSKNYKKIVKNHSVIPKPKIIDKLKKVISIKANSIDIAVKTYINQVYSGSIDKEILLEKANKLMQEADIAVKKT